MRYNPTGGGFSNLPEATKNLLIINVLMYIALITAALSFRIDLNNILGLHPWLADNFQPYQYVTSMFMHASIVNPETGSIHGGYIIHILFNMYALWMFGAILERVWGAKRFFIYYFFCGIGAGLVYNLANYYDISSQLNIINTFLEVPVAENFQAIINDFSLLNYYGIEMKESLLTLAESLRSTPQDDSLVQAAMMHAESLKEVYIGTLSHRVAVGASGAIFGLLLAFGLMFPNQKLFIFPIPMPIKALHAVLLLAAASVAFGFNKIPGDNIAHFAHLGGMIFGFILIKYPGFYKIR